MRDTTNRKGYRTTIALALFLGALTILVTFADTAEARRYQGTKYYGSSYKCDYYDSGPPNCYYLHCYRENGYAGSSGGRSRRGGRTNCTWVYDESGPCSTASASAPTHGLPEGALDAGAIGAIEVGLAEPPTPVVEIEAPPA